jgi:hypothetical protein
MRQLSPRSFRIAVAFPSAQILVFACTLISAFSLNARALHIDDVNAARLESAQVLLAFADGLTENWLSVLRCP